MLYEIASIDAFGFAETLVKMLLKWAGSVAATATIEGDSTLGWTVEQKSVLGLTKARAAVALQQRHQGRRGRQPTCYFIQTSGMIRP